MAKGLTTPSASAVTVAVIGTGATGLSMLKTLREDGFDATAFERRQRVGGLWSYTADKSMTSAMPDTVAQISKYTCGYSDYPIPDKYPAFLKQPEFEEFMEGYAENFNLYDHIVFGTNVKKVIRSPDDLKWRVEMTREGQPTYKDFDKVVFCHGYQTFPKMPKFVGQEKFEGEILHSQQFRDFESTRDKNVVIVGLGPTACDLAPSIASHAASVHLSHRNGAWIFSQTMNGRPTDLIVNHSRRKYSFVLQQYFPNLAMMVTASLMRRMAKRHEPLEPEWRLPGDAVPIQLSLGQAVENILPYLRDGSVKSMHGIKEIRGPRTIEFTDGQVLEDVDMILCCTGYGADLSVAPCVEFSKPANDETYGGPPIARLYRNIFPPKYADSLAILAYSAYGKNNGFSFADVTSMAISNIWRGVSADMIPSEEEMDKQIDQNQAWIAHRWHKFNGTDVSAVKQWEFQGFLHDAAGTGMENLGWGWKGWLFFLRDPRMSWLMSHGVETAHAFRYFETGKRATWPGARDAIIHVNNLVTDLKLPEGNR